MNEKFFALPAEKQQRILNAAYRVFSQSSYKKSPVSEIAAEAGISKSLLFHYFRNKKDLYLYLWQHAADVTIRFMSESGCYEPTDLFEMMRLGMQAKLRIMTLHPDLAAFTIRAYYERDPEIEPEIQKSYLSALARKSAESLARVNPADFRPGLDLRMMYREMYWASEGYLWEKIRSGTLDINRLEADFTQLLDFWKSIYSRSAAEKGGQYEHSH
ncbi:MAG: TetR/AcrR family transcriptional regulator [Hominenteromicrobium sp.]